MRRQLGIALCAAAALVGCGGGDGQSDEDAIRSTIEELQAAYADHDPARGCANITQRAHILIGVMGHDTPADCQTEVDKVFRWMRGDLTDPPPRQPLPELVEVEVNGNRATATVAAPGNPASEAEFVKRGDKWRIDSVFGTEVASYQRESGYFDPKPVTADAKAVRTPVATADVRALAAGRKCPAVDTSDAPKLSGGCLLRMKGPIAMGVTSVFGTWRFEDPCEVSYPIRVDGQGRTWSRGFLAAGHSPCPDVKPCGKAAGGVGDEVPWRGRIEQGEDGALYHSVERACLNTCLGLFRGPLRMKLVRSGKGWRMESEKTNIGVSGWQFNDPLESPPNDLDFEPAEPA